LLKAKFSFGVIDQDEA